MGLFEFIRKFRPAQNADETITYAKRSDMPTGEWMDVRKHQLSAGDGDMPTVGVTELGLICLNCAEETAEMTPRPEKCPSCGQVFKYADDE